jgi:hypothetical protein
MKPNQLTPQELAELVRFWLPPSAARMSHDDRLYWTNFMNALGEDGLESLRRTVAFMCKAGSF